MENKYLKRSSVVFLNGKAYLDDPTLLYVIDWEDVLENKGPYELFFKENQTLQLVEHGNPKGQLIYHVDTNACVNLSIASLTPTLSSSREFKLLANSNVVVAIADFAPGQFRSSFMVDIEQKGASLHFHLATLATESDKKEFTVSFNHLAGDTYAEMNNYGVCEGNSRLVFSGIGHILKGSKRSKTHQNAKIMVFDPHCQALANPILKIDENDVEASHAASVGRVNDEHLFYLTSRGLKEEEAKQLITLGYLKPILKYFDEQESELISSCMERRMK